MKRLASAILASSLAVQPAFAAPQTATDILLEHKLPIARDANGRYSGKGWDRMIADARSAQFFMAGEQHGVRDIAQFMTAAQAELAKTGGYTHSALEVGPYSTAFAETLIRQQPGKLAAYIAAPGHGFTLPFLFFKEEIALTENIVARSPDREHALWGLDQEFVGAAPIVAAYLGERAITAQQRAAVAAFRAKSDADPLLVSALTDADLDPLRTAFAGNAEAVGLIDALRLSREIYEPFVKGGKPIYPANLARENYMKVNFARQFAEAEKRLGKPPKVFMKFGGYHAMRGHSGTDVPSLTNFLSEWGLPRGFTVANVMVDCNGGEAMNPQTGKPAPCEPYFGKDSLFGRLATDDVTMIALVPLREKLSALKDIDPRTRQTILAFDYYVTIRDGKAATPAGTMPAR